MRSQTPEVSDVFRSVAPRVSSLKLSNDKLKIFQAIISCRTEKLGGHIKRCDKCGHAEQAYNSCLNRHCPKCRGGEAFSWVNERSEELLPVPYFHVVFTIPQELRELVYANKKLLYDNLFRASSDTLLDVSRNNLGVKAGFFGVLHTWNQELGYHPHIHYMVPGGGICKDTGKWQPTPRGEKFLLPVRILSKVFRGKFIEGLKRHYRKLYLPPKYEYLRNPRAFEHFLSKCASHEWVVYAKRPFAGPEVVVRYLANYTHRVGISNSRIREVTANSVTFVARDRNNHKKRRLITISNETFVCRFLQHGLPKGFRRVRYFGFLSVHQKAANLAELRRQLGLVNTTPEPFVNVCIVCGLGNMIAEEFRKPHRISVSGRFLSPSTSPLCLSPPSAVH